MPVPEVPSNATLEDKMLLAQTAYRALKNYDGSHALMGAIAEIWAERTLGLTRAARGAKDIDGTLPNGRTLQVKAKIHAAHPDSATYVTVTATNAADDIVVVFIDHDGRVARSIGPFPVANLKRHGPGNRCYIHEMNSS